MRQPGGGEPHRRHQQPARQRHDPAPARTPVAGADVLHGPARQRAVRLVVEPAPGHPRQVFPQHRAAGLAGPRAWSTAPPGHGTGPGPAMPASCLRFRRSRQDSPAPSSSASFGPMPLSRPGTAAWRACAGTAAGAAPGGVSAAPSRPVPGASALSAPAASVTAACAPPSSPGPSRASRAAASRADLSAAALSASTAFSPATPGSRRSRMPPISARSPGGSPVPQAVRMPPGRARYPLRAGSPGGIPRGRRSPATAPASRSRSRTGRPRPGGRRLPSSSATVGTRTGDIASRSPPSQAGGARTVPRAPVRSVFAFFLLRTTSRLAGWRTTTSSSSPSRRRASRKPPYPAPWTGITRTSPPETAAARSRARTGFAGSPSTSVAAPARTGRSATRPPDRPPPGSSPCRSPAAPREPCWSPLRRVWSDRSSHSPSGRQGVPPVGPLATICWNHHIPLHRIAPRGKPRRVSWHLEAALERKVQVNRRQRLLDGAGEATLTMLACSRPPKGQARWTLQLLADRLVAPGVLETVPAETVRRTLKKRHQALDGPVPVHSAESERRFRLRDGGCAQHIPA